MSRLELFSSLLPLVYLVGSWVVTLPTLARPQAEDREVVWSAYLAQECHGVAEHRLPCGARVDVFVEPWLEDIDRIDWRWGAKTVPVAWEVEWPEKWKEAIGQALYYRASTGYPDAEGGVCLLVGRQPFKQELIHYQRCLVACKEADLRLVIIYVNDPPSHPAD